ncbi:hypothetical protein QI100_10955 [Staphylococcus saprophyticus]|nr:hypothetical protein [Staphylococcus saprophyticus]
MNCQIALKSGDSIMVSDFECIKAPRKTDGEMKVFKKEDIEKVNLIDGITYTIKGKTIVKIKGEQILYFHFK